MCLAKSTSALKPALGNCASRHTNVDQPANDGLTQPANRHARFEFGYPPLEKFLM
jgi:hypothetical protein